MLIVEKHFFHKITLFFTERPAKNWNIGGALRVAPVCSTPNTSLLSNLAVYNAERSELHQGSGKMLSGGPGRDSATRADGGAAGARSVTRDWSHPDQDPGSPPSSSSIWSHSTPPPATLRSRSNVSNTTHHSQTSTSESFDKNHWNVRSLLVISNNCWYFPHKERNKKFEENYYVKFLSLHE